MTGEIRSQNYHALNFIVIALESRSYNNDIRTFVRSRKMSSKNSFLRKSNSIQSCSKICSYSYVRSLDHINTRIGRFFKLKINSSIHKSESLLILLLLFVEVLNFITIRHEKHIFSQDCSGKKYDCY